MATMIPGTAGRDATPGERQVFELLRECGRPHEDVVVWSKPQWARSVPDFVLWVPGAGIVVLEVKDWGPRELVEVGADRWVRRVGGKLVSDESPRQQARDAMHELMDRMKQHPRLVTATARHRGRARLPTTWMVAFPNLHEREFEAIWRSGVLTRDDVWLAEDLDPRTPVFADPTGAQLRAALASRMPFPAPTLDADDRATLRMAVSPSLQVGRGAATTADDLRASVVVLDRDQEATAQRLGPGDWVLYGPAGTGKTMVLLHRARLLLRGRPGRRILVACPNVALASRLKRLVLEQGCGVGHTGIDVQSFHELAAELLGRPLDAEPSGGRDERVVGDLLRRMSQLGGDFARYDAVLVDEGQDFTKSMLKVLRGLRRPDGEFVLSFDPDQDLYVRGATWKSLGIDAVGHVVRLRHAYRNTRQIREFTDRLAGRTTDEANGRARDATAQEGPPPEVLRAPEEAQVVDALIADLSRRIERGEVRRADAAVVYDDRSQEPGDLQDGARELGRDVTRRLEAAGIPAFWVSEDLRSKQLYDGTSDRVAVLSIHSAKGLEFELVYVLGADSLHWERATAEAAAGVLRVAATRARHRLLFVVSSEGAVVRMLVRCGAVRREA